MIDVNDLHKTVDLMHQNQDDVVHSLNQHTSYFKQLDGNIKFNHQAMVNLSATVRKFAESTQATFQEISSKFDLGAKLRDIAIIIRELEFALIQAEIHIDELMTALQALMIGKVPVNLITPRMLHYIIKNVSLSVPDGYDLVAGSEYGQLTWYYELIQVNMISSSRGFFVILSIPLKDDHRRFEVYEMHSFFSKLINQTYVRYDLTHDYFAINVPQRTHFAMTEAELLRCKGHGIKVCRANRPIYSMEEKTCPLSLYLQLDDVRTACSRRVTTAAPAVTFIRHGSSLVYHLLTPQPVFFRCRKQRKWDTESILLHGPGILRNTEQCLVTTNGMQLYPVLSGETTFTGQVPALYTPILPPVIEPSESLHIRELTSTTGMADLESAIKSHHLDTDVDTLLLMQPSTRTQAQYLLWYVPMLTSAGTVLVLYGMHLISRLYWRKVMRLCKNGPPLGENTDDKPPLATPTTSGSRDGYQDEPAQLGFVKYPRLPS
jgi:hypothetical protein